MRSLISLLILLAFASVVSAAGKPNVLLIVTDDQGYGDFGFTGNPQLQTPVLDALAKQSARFERFYVTPFCAPTRAALLTGRYGLRTGVHGVARGQETMRTEETTVAELLRDAGWRTGLFGKWHNGENYPYTPNGQGFEEALGFNLGHWNNYFDPRLRHNAEWVKEKGWISDVLTDAALGFIEKNRAQPWLCYLAYNAPHSPFQCPDKEFAKYKAMGLDDTTACVYGMCENLDTNIGRVLAKLDEWKLAEDTIVIFFTDNGPATERFTSGLRGKKGSLYEGGSRTPLLVRIPGKAPRVVPTLAAAFDILPTICELCGVPAKTAFPLDGRSLVPLLEGRSDGWPERTLFIQNLAQRDLKRTQGAVVTQNFTAVNPGKGWELYDINADPGQKQDLAAKQPDVAAELGKKFEAWWTEVSQGVTRDRPPIPVGHAQEPIVEASAAQAELDGGLTYSAKAPNNAWIVGWGGEAARAEWKIEPVQAGRYELGVSFTRANADPATKLRLEISGRTAEASLPQTAVQEIPQPNRAVQTSESRDMVWQSLSVGQVDLSAGEQTLSLRLTAPDASFALKHLSLRLIK
ncbi:MAG: sulfatase-like hydrolase/transferase [Chthoniobacteraceae bacterium]